MYVHMRAIKLPSPLASFLYSSSPPPPIPPLTLMWSSDSPSPSLGGEGSLQKGSRDRSSPMEELLKSRWAGRLGGGKGGEGRRKGGSKYMSWEGEE